jgi:hypothetical protein
MTTTLIDECNIAAYRSWPDRRVTPTCAPSASCLGSLVSPDVALYATTGASGVKGDGSGADREAGGDGLAVDARLPPRHSQSGMAVGAAPPTTPAERRRHLTVHPGPDTACGTAWPPRRLPSACSTHRWPAARCIIRTSCTGRMESSHDGRRRRVGSESLWESTAAFRPDLQFLLGRSTGPEQTIRTATVLLRRLSREVDGPVTVLSRACLRHR